MCEFLQAAKHTIRFLSFPSHIPSETPCKHSCAGALSACAAASAREGRPARCHRSRGGMNHRHQVEPRFGSKERACEGLVTGSKGPHVDVGGGSEAVMEGFDARLRCLWIEVFFRLQSLSSPAQSSRVVDEVGSAWKWDVTEDAWWTPRGLQHSREKQKSRKMVSTVRNARG